MILFTILVLSFLVCCMLEVRCSLTAPHLQHTANQDGHDQYGKQHHIRELLMMGILMLETCLAYKKYNNISSGIWLVF